MRLLLDTHTFLWMIIAQALCEELTVVGKDEVFDKYNVKRIWN
jgi:PIN domain nuclease of toxin-antitoxin system